MNHKAKFDSVVKSRAWLELQNTPLAKALQQQVVEGFKEGFEEAGSDGEDLEDFEAMLKEMMGDDQYEDLKRLLIDIASQEAFVYGGPGFSELMEINQKFIREVYEGMTLEEDYTDETNDARVKKALDHVLNNELGKVRVPDLVIGFTLKDPELAKKHLELLHAFATLGMAGGEIPREVRQGYRKKELENGLFISVKLRGDLLPLGSLMEELSETEPEMVRRIEQLFGHVADMTLQVSLGVYDQYLLVSVGDDLEHIVSLAEKEKLIDQEQMAPIHEYFDRPMSSIVYVSDRFAKAAFPKYIKERFITAAHEMRIEGEYLADDGFDFDTASKHLKELGEIVEQNSLPPGGSLQFSFLSEEGIEGFHFSNVIDPGMVEDQPLTLLDQLDESPALWFGCRRNNAQQRYAIFSKLWSMTHFFGTELISLSDDEDLVQVANLLDALEQVHPQVDSAVNDHLIPATDDGQAMFVLDVKAAQKQWGTMMQSSNEPLPVPELAMICGVNDRDEFMQAMRELDQVGRNLMALMEAPAEINLPTAESYESDDGELIRYPITELESIGLDAALMPYLGINDDVAVFATNLNQTQRLLSKKPYEWEGSFEAYNGKPIAMACEFNHVKVVDAIDAWYRYAVQMGAFEDIEDVDLNLTSDEFVDSIDVFLRTARCFQGFRSVTTVEDEVTRVHYLWRFQDLPW